MGWSSGKRPFLRKPRVGPLKRQLRVSFGPINLRQPINESILGINPGIGGTEFSLVLLAHAFMKNSHQASVSLDYVGGPVSGLEKLQARRFDSFGSYNSDGDVVVAPVSSVMQLEPHQFIASDLIVICQHPHDRSLPLVIKRFRPKGVMHVGIYSFWSNFRPEVANLYVPNLMPRQSFSNQPANQRTEPSNKVGFLGALVDGKRFHEVAGVWGELSKVSPGVVMEVMGSSSTHSGTTGHPELPTSHEYGQKLFDSFGVNRLSDLSNVSFLGNVGEEKSRHIRNWAVGITNPTGGTESFCYSFRELIYAGVPTLAGKREGMAELVSQFRGLGIRHSTEIPEQVASILRGDFDFSAFERQRRRFIRKATRLEEDRVAKFVRFVALVTLKSGMSNVYLQSLRTWPLAGPSIVLELVRNHHLTKLLHRGVDFLYRGYRGIFPTRR